jgi:hypothetical protein
MGTRKSNKKIKKKEQFTPLKKHRREGSLLKTALSELNIEAIDWEKDLLPEHLWIAGLADLFNIDNVHHYFYEFMDIMDSYIPEKQHSIGFLSDFSLIPQDRRDEFKQSKREQIWRLFYKPIGRILAFYPENPASWLLDQEMIQQDGPLDPQTELGRLRGLLLKLYPAKDEYAGHIRTLPFARIVKHHLVKVPDNKIVDLCCKYPNDCTPEEKYHLQSFARTLCNMVHSSGEHYKGNSWAKYFWRHNWDIVICKPGPFNVFDSRPVSDEDIQSLKNILDCNSKIIHEYLNNLWKCIKCDLYNPIRDEILFGLFSRILKFYCLILEDPNAWARDLSGVILRCLTEYAINFAYLSKQGTNEEFNAFKSFGDGQEKLLMLQLQDNYENEMTLEGRDVEAISHQLGGFNIETINIELGHWLGKDTRQLAQAAGLERYYRLVFTPTSGDIHGSWFSLKESNLIRCIEPLHRFHWLPANEDPPIYANTIQLAKEICEYCISMAVEKLHYPSLSSPLLDITIENNAANS